VISLEAQNVFRVRKRYTGDNEDHEECSERLNMRCERYISSCECFYATDTNAFDRAQCPFAILVAVCGVGLDASGAQRVASTSQGPVPLARS
jgi:hypothetical protein